VASDDGKGGTETAGNGTQRLDKWLWFARIVKSRSLAQKLVTGGHVRVNRDKTNAPAKAVRAGDVLTVAVAGRVLVLKVLAPGTRRGPAPEAQQLYEDLQPRAGPAEGKGESREPAALAAPPARRAPGSGRPTKRERRELDRLRGDGEG
jgi:ribosome-associated heat shock protein Hsp15